MDTSIIVVIAIIVVFVVAVPAMIRRSATELSRVDIDRVPDQARVIDPDAQSPCRDHTARARVFHSDTTATPSVPRAVVEPLADTPQLRLSSPVPALTVIDGHVDGSRAEATAGSRSTAIGPGSEAGPQQHALPLAVGQSHRTSLVGSHEAAGANGPSNVHRLRPSTPAMADRSAPTAGPTGSGRGNRAGTGQVSASTGPGGNTGLSGRQSGDRLGEGVRPLHSTTAMPSGSTPGAGTPPRQGRSAQTSKRNFPADEDYSMTENRTTLQESLSALGTMIRGFALVLLASLLGILVTGVLAIFSVVHPALIGVFAGLSVIALIIVRTLNLRKWEIRKQLRELETTPAQRAAAGSPVAPRADARRGAAASQPERPSTSGRGATAMTSARSRSTATSAGSSAGASTSAGAGASAGARASGASATAVSRPGANSGGSVKAAQARAVIERNASAKRAREEATTGEIPIVHIRNEAAAGHTTRQVLLTGPIPVVEDRSEKPSTAADGSAAAESGTAETAGAESGRPGSDRREAARSASERREAARTAPERVEAPAATTTSTVESEAASTSGSANGTTTVSEAASTAGNSVSGASTAGAGPSVSPASEAAESPQPAVSDPFMQRLQTRDGWSPTPLPVPSYVDAPEVDHPIPAATKADMTSYEIEPRSREDIAAQFAAELGYRQELSDSARDESPLVHGRKAIRTSKAPELGAVNDVLARRRA
ncbi:hypothetical protein DFO66_10478 [Brevibacterium sanguinis]|uniref:Uncharacterized protein n=2 Tax=Brevibacterium TaxID=1696 RepID=A0A366IJ43_9MICO|nr:MULTISPECIES: hypothetical protein [Brevibacterium]RBP65495.1 hypothetical protein DFO66_10478 [Brevibacterium sanguinis]RBP72129.1 hypothetical protein DFO65_10484 [Brevibacterium celere]